MRKLTETELAAAADRAEALLKEASSDPETRAELEKLGFSFGNMLRGAGEAVKHYAPAIGGQVAGAAALGLGFGAANKAIQATSELLGNAGAASRKAKAYEAMMEQNPDLSEHDSGQLHAAFNTLSRFNPQYSEDPMVAGAFVQQVVEQERMPLQTVNELVKARSTMDRGEDGGGIFNPLGPAMSRELPPRPTPSPQGGFKF